nr:hypothetical protein [Tanacetum cinerariifolium]
CHGCGQPCDGYYCESCTCPQCGMTLFNGICDNCIYGAGMPIICTACGGIADVEKVLHDREKFIQDTQTFLEKFNQFSFGFTPRVLTIAWERIDKIKYVLTKPEEIPELMYKLREDVQNIREEEYLEKSPDSVTTILPTEEPKHLLRMGRIQNLFDPLFDEDEINSDKIDPHCFNVESDFVESLLNRDTFIDFSSKFDFSEELNAEIADTIIESIPLLPIPVQDGNSQQEEIDIITETDDVLPSSDENDDDYDPLLGEADLFLSDNSIPPGIENVADNPEGDIRFLEELLIDDSILSDELFDANFEENPSIPQPPPKPPDVESFFDLKPDVIAEEISDKLNEDKCFDPGGEIFVSTNSKDVDYFPFMFVIRIFLPYLILPEISPLLLSAESEDTIFDPGISD